MRLPFVRPPEPAPPADDYTRAVSRCLDVLHRDMWVTQIYELACGHRHARTLHVGQALVMGPLKKTRCPYCAAEAQNPRPA